MESGDPPRRTRSASVADDVVSHPASRELVTSDHVPPEALVARGRGEARKDTGNRPRLAGRRGGAPVSHVMQRRRCRGDDQGRTVETIADQGWTVFQIPSAPLGSWQPLDGARVVQIM